MYLPLESKVTEANSHLNICTHSYVHACLCVQDIFNVFRNTELEATKYCDMTRKAVLSLSKSVCL